MHFWACDKFSKLGRVPVAGVVSLKLGRCASPRRSGTASLQVWAFPAGWEGLPALPAKWAAGTPISQVCLLQIRTPETLNFDTLRTIFVQFVHNHTLAGHVGQFRSQWHESWPSRDAACKTPRGSSTAYVSATVMGMQIAYPSVLLRRPSAATCRTLSRGSCNL